jgi:hypothetical protein
MKGARFADVATIQERVTAVLRSIPKEAFADSLQKLYERCQQCLLNDGDYFEGQLCYLFVSFVLFVFWYNSPNVLDTPRKFQPHRKHSLSPLLTSNQLNAVTVNNICS